MSEVPKNVLFLCTGNSARSILAEAILNRLGNGEFAAYSAGSQPTGKPNPGAIELLEDHGYDTAFARSKNWDEFAASSAPEMDFVFTVCSNAAGETCPVWPGRPHTDDWSIDDPATAIGTRAEIRLAFETAYDALQLKISTFLTQQREPEKAR